MSIADRRRAINPEETLAQLRFLEVYAQFGHLKKIGILNDDTRLVLKNSRLLQFMIKMKEKNRGSDGINLKKSAIENEWFIIKS